MRYDGIFKTRARAVYALSAAAAGLPTLAAAAGLVVDDLYRDNAFSTSSWFGNDLVTVFVAVPILVIALVLSVRGSGRAQLVLLGMLDYTRP
jgi:hypothetical protein